MRLVRRATLVPLALGACLAAAPETASGQGFVPASSPHPVILVDAYLDVPALLLTPPRGFGIVGSRPAEREARMAAYRDFERALGERLGTPAPGTASHGAGGSGGLFREVGRRLESLPGARLVARGRALWKQVEETTDFDVQGFRVRLLVDEAVEGKLALKVQKKLR